MPRASGRQDSDDFAVSETFKNPDADLRIVSIDEVEFQVYKAILTEGSAVFRDMLRTPQPASASPNAPVPWPEPAWVIERLLQYMYPIPKSSIRKLDQCITLLRAADKWQIDIAVWMLRQELVATRFLDSKPLRVYSAACQMGLEKEKEIASRKACGIDPCDPAVRDQIDALSAIDLLWLLHLRSSQTASPKDFFPEPDRKTKPKASTKPEPKLVAPFTVPEVFRPPNGDLILESADGVEFGVHRLFLTEASPVLKATLDDPVYATPTSPTSPLIPTLTLAEFAPDICDILYYMYPIPKPKTQRSIDDITRLIRIAKEWKFQLALSALSEELVSPAHLQSQALRVYGLARRLGLVDVERKALERAIATDPLSHTDKKAYRDLTAVDLLHVVDVRNKLIQSAVALAQTFKYNPPKYDCYHKSSMTVGLRDFVLERLSQTLRARPLPDALDSFGCIDGLSNKVHYCPTCALDAGRHWELKEPLDLLKSALEAVVADALRQGAP